LADIVSQPDGSVRCSDTTDVNRIFDGRLSYSKGAYLLHMLRWKMGDATFFQALTNYQTDANLSNGYARTPDLKAHLENASGLNLANFFNQWYYNQGFPSYQIVWNQVGTVLTFTVNQTQSHNSVSFFEMPIPIKFIGNGNDTTIIVNHQFSGQVFTANINFTIQTAVFDPEMHIISANNTVTGINDLAKIENDVRVFPNPASNELNISIQQTTNEKYNLEIVTMEGKLVLTETQIAIQKSAIHKINIAALNKGEYILRIKGSKTNWNKKFIKN
jgi:aminopeptidase N